MGVCKVSLVEQFVYVTLYTKFGYCVFNARQLNSAGFGEVRRYKGYKHTGNSPGTDENGEIMKDVNIFSAAIKTWGAEVQTFFIGRPSLRGAPDNNIQMIRTTECDIPIKDFGKTVFLTREAAEAALKEMEQNE